MVFDVGVEVGTPGLDHDFAQQARGGELMKRVVDRGERNPHLGGERLLVQLLRAQVPIAAILQKPDQGQTLARWPEARRLQPLDQTAIGTLVRHVPQYSELGGNLKANTVN